MKLKIKDTCPNNTKFPRRQAEHSTVHCATLNSEHRHAWQLSSNINVGGWVVTIREWCAESDVVISVTSSTAMFLLFSLSWEIDTKSKGVPYHNSGCKGRDCAGESLSALTFCSSTEFSLSNEVVCTFPHKFYFPTLIFKCTTACLKHINNPKAVTRSEGSPPKEDMPGRS